MPRNDGIVKIEIDMTHNVPMYLTEVYLDCTKQTNE